MSHTSANEFVKKSRKRELAKQGDIFVAGTHVPPPNSVYLPEQEEPHLHTKIPHEPVSPPPELEVPSKPSTAPAVKPKMTAGEIAKFLVMRSVGNFLILFSLYGVVATFGPALYFETQFRVAQARGVQFTVKEPPQGFPSYSGDTQSSGPGFGDVISGAKEQVLVPPDTRFSVVIPRIGATAKVHPNVDPLNEKDFLPKLQTGVAHAKGSVFPGMEGNVYLFAHSTDNFWDVGRYNAVFYLLKDLRAGDDISVYFEDRRYNYKVDHTVVKDPTDVDLLVHSQLPGQQQLILQTCWPPGTTWKRLFVIAKPQ